MDLRERELDARSSGRLDTHGEKSVITVTADCNNRACL